MCRREVMDDFLRKRAKSLGANLVNGLFMKLEDPGAGNVRITIHYNDRGRRARWRRRRWRLTS